VLLDSSDLEFVLDNGGNQTVGMRFTALNIPTGASIVAAWIQFQVDEVTSVATSLNIQAQDIDSAPTFTSVAGSISSRIRTSASVPWSPVAWNNNAEAGPNQRTPDISAVIQQIVDRPGWASGNALAIIVTGTGHRVAESFNGLPAAAPLLHVEYTTGMAINVAARNARPANNRRLDEADLRTVVGAAIIRLVKEQGFSPDTFDDVAVEIADLPGSILGRANRHRIQIDADGAGYGWYVDRTPFDDREFEARDRHGRVGAARRASEHVDLLTVVMHELAHAAGSGHTDHGLMHPTLLVGVRRTGMAASTDHASPPSSTDHVHRLAAIDESLSMWY
jgi:hypothetical protein